MRLQKDEKENDRFNELLSVSSHFAVSSMLMMQTDVNDTFQIVVYLLQLTIRKKGEKKLLVSVCMVYMRVQSFPQVQFYQEVFDLIFSSFFFLFGDAHFELFAFADGALAEYTLHSIAEQSTGYTNKRL